MTQLEWKNIERNKKYARRLMFGLKLGSNADTKCYLCKNLFSLKVKSYAKEGYVFAEGKCSECGYVFNDLWVKPLRTKESNE